MNPDPSWTTVVLDGFAGAGAAWLLALVIRGFIFAPIKAYYKTYKQLKISVVNDFNDGQFSGSEFYQSHNAAVMVRNLTDESILDCSLKLIDLKDENSRSFARFIEKFDLPPYKTRLVPFAHWFSREPPNVDDAQIGINGPVSPGFGGNIFRVAADGFEATLEVSSPEIVSRRLRCRLSVDKAARKLKAVTVEAK